MSTLMRWIIAIALVAIGSVAQGLAYNLPIDGALGVVWRMFTSVVILHALIFIIAFRLFKKKPPPETEN